VLEKRVLLSKECKFHYCCTGKNFANVSENYTS